MIGNWWICCKWISKLLRFLVGEHGFPVGQWYLGWKFNTSFMKKLRWCSLNGPNAASERFNILFSDAKFCCGKLSSVLQEAKYMKSLSATKHRPRWSWTRHKGHREVRRRQLLQMMWPLTHCRVGGEEI